MSGGKICHDRRSHTAPNNHAGGTSIEGAAVDSGRWAPRSCTRAADEFEVFSKGLL